MSSAVERAAWRATRWILTTGRRYGIHEMMSALMHLRLCRALYPKNAYLGEQWADAPDWFTPQTRTRILRGVPLPDTIHISTHLILLDLMKELGLVVPPTGRTELVRHTREVAERSLSKVRRLSTAAEWWILAHALSLHGVALCTEPLARLDRRLPPVTRRTNPWTSRSIDAFNYCTHFVLFRTHYLHVTDGSLRTARAVRWLSEFWRRTDMRDDVEYRSQCLNSLSAAGASLPEREHASALRAIVEAQAPTGCFRGHAETTRYDRFHVAWCAADALHRGAAR